MMIIVCHFLKAKNELLGCMAASQWSAAAVAHLESDHVLGYALKQCQKAALSVEPGVGLQLLALRLHRFDDPGYAKLVVAFHAVQGTNDQVHNAEMKAAPGWVLQEPNSQRSLGT